VTPTLPSFPRRPLPLLLLGALLLGAAPAAAGVRVGDVAPSFTLPDATARPIALAGLRGRIVVLDFTASWCVACRTALPALATLGARYADRGVEVVTVVIDASRPNAERFLAEVVPAHRMTVLFDPTAQLLARFGAAGMPALYVIDGSGVVRLVESGYGAERIAAVEATVTRLLAAGETPRQATLPAD
jgi:cytochrome c biogenesis protein CcmG/thiol:disulfide interchange protein DsbE